MLSLPYFETLQLNSPTVSSRLSTPTWKNKPGIGLFIHAVKSGQKPSLTRPGCGWKEWADEATKRRLMEYSTSHDGDIMVHLVGGTSRLWSQLRGLSWSEVERARAEEML